MLFKLSNLNSNLGLTLGYLNSALNYSAQETNFQNINSVMNSNGTCLITF